MFRVCRSLLFRVLPTGCFCTCPTSESVRVLPTAESVHKESWKSRRLKGYSTRTPKALQNKFCRYTFSGGGGGLREIRCGIRCGKRKSEGMCEKECQRVCERMSERMSESVCERVYDGAGAASVPTPTSKGRGCNPLSKAINVFLRNMEWSCPRPGPGASPCPCGGCGCCCGGGCPKAA